MVLSRLKTTQKLTFAALIVLLSFIGGQAQDQPSSPWATDVGSRYWVQPDIVYLEANNRSLKLDVWYQHGVTTPTPTLVYIHGGGWIFGTKESSVLQFLPFLEKGWTVVNVEYRMAGNSLAPAAVEDTRCALRWVHRNASQWHFDTTKIVLTGHSAGFGEWNHLWPTVSPRKCCSGRTMRSLPRHWLEKRLHWRTCINASLDRI